MPDLGKEYHPARVRREGWCVLILFVAGLVIYIFVSMFLNLGPVLLLAALFGPFIIMGLSSLTVIEWELDPTRKDQRSVEAKRARHLRRMRKARSNIYALCASFFILGLPGFLVIAYLGWFSMCQSIFLIILVLFIAALALPLYAAYTVFSRDMEEHWVFIENGLIRQKSTPRIGHYRITPFRADQVKRAVWSTNSKGENMYVHLQMVRPEELDVYPIHQDTIKDETAFKAFLQGKLEEKDVPSHLFSFPTDY